MTRILSLTLFIALTACSSPQLKPAAVPLTQFKRIAVIVDSTMDASSFGKVQKTYEHTHLAPEIAKRLAKRLVVLHSVEKGQLTVEARTESVELSKDTMRTVFLGTEHLVMDSTKLSLSPNLALDSDVAAAVSKQYSCDAILLVRICAFNRNWRDSPQRSRRNLPRMEYVLRFGLALEYGLYDANTGSMVSHWTHRRALDYRLRHRRPRLDPKTILTSDDRIVHGRFESIMGVLAEDIVGRHLPHFE